MFDKQPSGAVSRQAQMDKQFEKAALSSGTEDQTTLTPTPTVLMAASGTYFRHLTQNEDDSQFGFVVPTKDGI